jgi:hypothetical protein
MGRVASAAAIAGYWVAKVVLKRSGIMRAATRFVVSPSMKTNCFLWIVFAGFLMQSFAETALCTILGGNERATHLERSVGTNSSS